MELHRYYCVRVNIEGTHPDLPLISVLLEDLNRLEDLSMCSTAVQL